ncbi:MAG: MarR family transcriptional regulator [Acidimicrobiia bacterium]|nr:MarR family transcriptional regulator [Acidimicrobiia bacterium]
MAIRFRVTAATETYGLLRSTVARIHDLLAWEMEDETGLPFDRYGLLLMLAQADSEELRPSDLADVLPITPSGVTRLIDRLERDGVVERRACSADGRGTIVGLTQQGEEVFRRAGRVHLRGIDQHIGAILTTEEMAELRRIMAKLAAGIDAAPTATESRSAGASRKRGRTGRDDG